MNRWLGLGIVFLGVLGTAVSGGDPDYTNNTFFVDEPMMGIQCLPVSKNLWHGSKMDVTRPIQQDELQEKGEDFFTLEYGKALVFDSDRLREFDAEVKGDYRIENGKLRFQTGKDGWSVLFGSQAEDIKGRSAIRLGRGWGQLPMTKVWLLIDLEQNLPETEWALSLCRSWGNLSRFKISGRGKTLLRQEIGLGTGFAQTTGIRLECLTPGAEIGIRSIRIVPIAGECYWAREFNLDFEPVRGGFSFNSQINKWTDYDVYVNGRKVVTPAKSRKVDLSGYLKKGRNILVYRDEFLAGFGSWAEVLLELSAVGRNGERYLAGGDGNWRWSYTVPDNWRDASFSPSGWAKPRFSGPSGVEYLRNGTPVALGMVPFHPGPLDVKPLGTKYPVFDFNGDVGFCVAVPDGIAKPSVGLEIRNAENDKLVETLTVSDSVAAAPFRKFTVRPKVRDTGAYRLLWTLMSDGKTCDTRRGEMIVCGPLKQDTFALDGFEENLQKRLRLVQKIDCSKSAGPRDFLDHSMSGFGTRGKLNVGRVVTRDGMTYRETGSGVRDGFYYRLDIPELGKPMIAEIVYPDNENRYILASIAETYPVPMENNIYPLGSRSWANATGCVSTGGLMPLSHGPKKLRIVFFPCSKNAGLILQNYLGGSRAAACEINLYALDGDLPALLLPPTGRSYGNHNERVLFQNWGGEQDPRINGFIMQKGEMREGFWTAAYLGICNKLRYMRYAGHNASVDGIYMYTEGFPSYRGHDIQARPGEFDYFFPMLKMYRHNGIKEFLCFEYICSPRLQEQHLLDVSDREVRAGTRRTPYHVTRYGKQFIGFFGHGLNHLNPAVWESVCDVMQEIYSTYSDVAHVEGIFLVCGRIWLPGYPQGDYGQFLPGDIGYDDDTVEQFEHDTGIRLNISETGAERFARRHELLTGKYAKEYFSWRSRKLREKCLELQKIITAGSEKWHLFVVPQIMIPEQNAFSRANGTKEQQDKLFTDLLRDAGFDPSLYGKDSGLTLVPHVKMPVNSLMDMGLYGNYTNPEVRKLYRQNNAVYMSATDLNEVIDSRLDNVPCWWWRTNSLSIYDRKFSGAFAFSDLVDIVAGYTPRHIFQTWLDINETTGHAAESRRFLKAFYATPEREFSAAKRVRGVQAEVFGNYLRLVNDTPYSVSGRLNFHGSAFEAVYDRNFQNGAELKLAPYGIAVVQFREQDAASVVGKFHFAPETERLVLAQADMLLKDENLRSVVPAAEQKKIDRALKAGDAYTALAVMRSFPVFRYLKNFLDSAGKIGNQAKFLDSLKRTGSARINCGSENEFIDRSGRLWLPDQSYSGFRTYGNEYGTFNSRDNNMPIRGTDMPELYRTEIYGKQMFYYLPIPAGRYRVRLHVAETFDLNRVVGRMVSIRVPDGKTDHFNPVEVAGYATPVIRTYENLQPEDGMIVLELGGSPCLNAIEIERTGDAVVAAAASAAEDAAVFRMVPNGGTQVDGAARFGGALYHQEKPGFFRLRPQEKQDSLYFVAKKFGNPAFGKGDFTLSALVRPAKEDGQTHCLFGGLRLDFPVKNGQFRPAFVQGVPLPGKQFDWIYFNLPENRFFEAGKWHHIAVTISRSDRCALFVDGTRELEFSLERWNGVNLFPPSKEVLSFWLPPGLCKPDYSLDVAAFTIRDRVLSSNRISHEAKQYLKKGK